MKQKQVGIRIPEDLDKKIREFALEWFTDSQNPRGNYSRSLRFLVDLGILISKRLDKETIEYMLAV